MTIREFVELAAVHSPKQAVEVFPENRAAGRRVTLYLGCSRLHRCVLLKFLRVGVGSRFRKRVVTNIEKERNKIL